MTTTGSIQYAFTAGELSPDVHGRSDLEKHQLGAKELLNCWVDYRGSAMNRPGTEFVAPVEIGTANHRIFSFSGIDDDYVLVFTDNKMRVVQGDGYVIGVSIEINSMSQSTTLEIDIGLIVVQVGSFVYLDSNFPDPKLRNRYFRVLSNVGTVIELVDLQGNNVLVDDLTFDADCTVKVVYELTTGISSDILPTLQIEQNKFDVVLTSLDMRRKQLSFVAADYWSIGNLSNGSAIPSPSTVTVTATDTGTAGAVYAVAAVYKGREGPASVPLIKTGIVDYTDTAGQVTIAWSRISNADMYYIYRSLVVDPADNLTGGELLGYIGASRGGQFVDNNITPDFSKAPISHRNPFNQGGVDEIVVTGGGTGYAQTDVVSITGGSGTGFVGTPIVSASGSLQGVDVFDPGQDYELENVANLPDNYSFSFTGAGTGATLYAEATPVDGLHPRTYARFQQRNVFGGSYQYPMTIWGTSSGSVNDYGISSVVTASDSYTFELDADSISPIKHLLAIRTGLLAFTQREIFLLRAEEGISVSPVNALSEPQAYKGVSDAEPLMINIDVVFAERGGVALNAMLYTEYTNSFELQEISQLANHLLEDDKRIIRMSWFGTPHKLLMNVREDGVMLPVTYDRANNVFAWSTMETRGLFRDACVARVANTDVLYATAERYVEDDRIVYLEKFASRRDTVIENMLFLDSALTLPKTVGTDTLEITINGDEVNLHTIGSGVDSLSVGQVVFAAGGRCVVTEVVDSDNWTATIERAFVKVVPQTGGTIVPLVDGGAWEYVTPTDTVNGLFHLENAAVVALIDGDVCLGLTVQDGAVTLPYAGAQIFVGLPYQSRITSLAPTVAQQITEGKYTAIKEVSMRLGVTRGIFAGVEGGSLYEVPNRYGENWDTQINALNEIIDVSLESNFSEDKGVVIQQDYPLPMKVVSLVIDTVVEDL